MTPTPQETVSHLKSPNSNGERVVISGMSGLYPNARNIRDFSEILYNKVDPITTENHRWDLKHPDLSDHIGMVPDLNRFDSQFFKLGHHNASTMDIMSRKLLEQSYQAIYDAGLSPEHLRGKDIGVYVGTCFSETEKACFYHDSKVGSGLIGCSQTMFPNRISYWLDVKGPSYSIDQSCCSSVAVLEAAYRAIERGECEAAIVGAGSLCLHPQTMINFGRIITLSLIGKTKSFDENADGCVKSEAICVLFLQKAKNALRIYADLIHVKSIFTPIVEGENGPKFGFYRDAGMMAAFLKEFYKEANVSPNSVENVEAFGAGAREIDKAELEAFEEVFCINRDDPLIVGSVISNIGYTEAASGLASITKVLLGHQTGKVAANLNCTNPRQDIPALKDKRMIIATDHQPIHRTYTAINNLSYNGVNAHVLLKGHFKPKNLDRYKSSLPRLVVISGRHENAVQRILDDLECRSIDPEELALLHNIHEKRINGHLGRGYAIFDTNIDGRTICLNKKIAYFDDVERPLWFVYSGMGSQWNQMGLHLMRIPVFAAAIQRCHDVLKPKGIDLIHILTSEDKSVFNNILHVVVGITAVQIGLTDVIREIGIKPDNFIGHSLGEVACAYADGCFTAEQAILVSYARGRVAADIPVIHGSMAAVGLGYQQIKDMYPDDIFVACHNGPDSCTLSGPTTSMQKFIANLTSQGLFAKEVQTCNIAFHSKYLKDMNEPHLKILRELIKNPIERSKRWISTSIPQDMWHEDIAKYSSPEYHNNNMMNPVLFEESLKLVSSNAVLIEISPHGLLQPILNRSLPSDCRNIPLTKRGHPNNSMHLLNALGSLFMEGYNPQVSNLYPKVEFPVSTETASLSHLIEWQHDVQWDMPLYVSGEKRMSSSTKHLITLHDEEFKYLRGNVVRGRVVYPYAAALVATWDTLAMSLGIEKRKLSVQFKDVHLFAQPILHEQRQLRLNVFLHRGTGKFEVSDELSKMATGYINGDPTDLTIPNIQFESTEPLSLESKDVYELLNERDYSYRDEFRAIFKANVSLTKAQLLWTDNWVTLIDGILQLNALRVFHNTVCQPTYIRRICIDVDEHINKIYTTEDKKLVTAYVSDVHDLTKCGGITLDNIKFHKLPHLVQDSVLLKTTTFFPHIQSSVTNINSALQVFNTICCENINKDEINIVSVINYPNEITFNDFKDAIKCNSVKMNHSEILEEKLQDNKQILSKSDIVLVKNLSSKPDVLTVLCASLHPEVFILNSNDNIFEERSNWQQSTIYRVVSSINTGEIVLEFIKLGPVMKNLATVVSVNTQDDISQLNLKLRSLPLHKDIIVAAKHNTSVLPGLKEQIKKWRSEFENFKISMIIIDKDMIEEENLNHVRDLAFSVLKNGIWGGEYLLPWEGRSAVNTGVILQSSHLGNLESLKWVEAPVPNGSGIVVDVHYAGLNDCDVKRATGVIPFKEGQELIYGMDFSGKIENGNSVMGLVSAGAICSKVIARSELLWDVPQGWSLQEAATVPLAYSMAFYCLKLKAEITNGITILILGGAGALGQAVISIALAYGCTVFTTVRDHHKKQLLLKLFPKLDDINIGYSRDALFRDMVLRATKGEGCNIVITCATGELKDVSLNCCAFSGVTIDTVQISSKEKYAFGLHHLTKQRSYVAIDFSSIFDYMEDMERIKELVTDGIEKGYVRPLTYTTYSSKEVVAAFKLSESNRRCGRVLISVRDSALKAESRFTCDPNYWQIVFCDDVIGVQFTEKLIHHGARKLLVNCSSPLGLLQHKIRSWAKLGVQVEISIKDLTNVDEVASVLKKFTSKGKVEGIFLFTTSNENEELETIILKLDMISRKLSPSLKYFLMASNNQSFGRKVYLSRTEEQLPVTIIHLPFQNVVTEPTSQNISKSEALDAIFKILVTPNANVFVYPKENKQTTLVQELASISGIEIPINISLDTTLQELGIADSKIQTIKAYLRDSYNTYFEENKITSLTVKTIGDIEKNSSWCGFEDLKGLQIFYSHIDSDEVRASIPTVVMKTRAKYWREYEFDVNIKSLCVIPGLEGHHDRFQLICERLKLPAYTIQPGYENPEESIQNTAQRYAQILIKKMKIKDDFYLLGYESGVVLALETAKILEKNGRKGTVFCVGQTPEELKLTIENTIGTLQKNGSDLEDAVAKHMVNLIKGDMNAFEKIETEVKAAVNWKDKLEICVEELVGHNGHTSQYLKSITNAALKRIVQIRSYEIEEFRLSSKIVLLHSASSFDPMTMQRFSKQPIAVHEIETPLGHLLQDLRCSTIINQYLSQDVVNLFEQNNLCETYLFNGNTFLFVPCPE